MTDQPINPAAAAATIAAMQRHYDGLGDKLYRQGVTNVDRSKLIAERQILRGWLALYETEAGLETFRTEAA